MQQKMSGIQQKTSGIQQKASGIQEITITLTQLKTMTQTHTHRVVRLHSGVLQTVLDQVLGAHFCHLIKAKGNYFYFRHIF